MTPALNPWVLRPASVPDSTPVPTELRTAATGPRSPQRDVPAPPAVDQLPTVRHQRTARLWWLGVHGGAGESTLATLLPGSMAAQHGWPQTPNQTQPSPVVLTARSNLRGLTAARNAAAQWAAGMVPFVELLGLVIIADAPGKLPKALRDLCQVVAGGVPRTWTVPWIDSWRVGDHLDVAVAPRQVRRLADDLRPIMQSGASAPPSERKSR